ncbi:MAG TPA: hypothetical protein VMU40_10025 [Steroidobacteraceae bacterium]|nr:hypothetical protein [Steroidobacteraceae bacterium]
MSSLVEIVLKRMQAEGSGAPARRVFGKVIQTAASPATPGRVISIDQEALRAAGLLPPKHQEREIASQYRQIKRPLIAAAMGKVQKRRPVIAATTGKAHRPPSNARLILVGSALPAEGKTFTAVNLAFSMTLEKDLEVVLVDGDVAKPQISKMFGVDAEPGLLDAATDASVDLERLILPTDVPNLFLLPSGARSDEATELLASEQMVLAVDALLRKSAKRIFIFDSSPLLLTTEALTLAELAGQIVLVVRADHTEHHVLTDALSRLPEDASVSLVLNQSTMKSRGYYYYGYGPPAQEAGDE